MRRSFWLPSFTCNTYHITVWAFVGIVFFCFSGIAVAASPWQMQEAIIIAIERDAIVGKLGEQAKAANDLSVASHQLPDPLIKLSARNFPTDTFDFDQEPMTQIAVGVSQMFPAGDTLDIKRDIQLKQEVLLQQLSGTRVLKITEWVKRDWLEVFYWQQAVKLLNKDKALFQHLSRVTRSMYSVGRKQQHDIIRAELEISKLKERLIMAHRQVERNKDLLSRWTGEVALSSIWPDSLNIGAMSEGSISVGLNQKSSQYTNAMVATSLQQHPKFLALDSAVKKKQLNVELAEQGFKPSWGIDITYAHRDGEHANGSSRPDFFSAMLNVKLPLFTKNRQDKAVSASRYELEAQRYEYIEALRAQTANFMVVRNRWLEMKERIALYQQEILKQSTQQAKATLTAYESDTADFSELMRAYLNDQKTQLDYYRLIVNEQQQLAKLNSLIGTSIDASLKMEGEQK